MNLPSIEAVVESFKEKFAVEYHDEQGDFLRTTLTTHQEQVIKACVEVLEEHHKTELKELEESNNQPATKMFIRKGLDIYKQQLQAHLEDLTSKV